MKSSVMTCLYLSLTGTTVTSSDSPTDTSTEPTYDSISIEKNVAYESSVQIVTHDNVAYEKTATLSGAGLNSVHNSHKQTEEVVVYI